MRQFLYLIFLLPGLLQAQAPIVSAGPAQQLQLPTTTTTLTGTATGVSGATIVSTVWTVVVDPGSSSITSPNSLTTGVTGMTIWGNRVYKLVAKDNHGLKDSAYVRVNIDPACNVSAPVRYNLTASGNEVYRPDGRSQPWKGVDTLCLPASVSPLDDVIFGGSGANGLSGDPCHPIVIMGPDAGQCITRVLRFDDHCQYIKVITNPRNPNPYSILTYTMGGSLSNHIDIYGVDINGSAIAGAGATGIIWKRHIDTLSNGAIVPETIRNNYVMNKIHLHNIRIRHSDGEGMYIGPTAPNGGDGQGPDGFFPVLLDSVEIDHITMDSTGWDGIQLSGGGDGCSIHDNTVTHYGLINLSSQQAGIIAGGSSRTDVYNNTITNGTGNGLQIFGYDFQSVYNNTLDSCGMDGSTTGGLHGQATIFQDDIPSIVESHPGQKVVYYGNAVQHPQTFGAIRIQNDRGTGLVDTIRGNTFCIPGASSGTYQGLYIFTSPTAVFTGNTLTTTCGAVAANAGPDQTITLPTSSATLDGTASVGATTYLWTKISGPGATTILNNTTSTPTATGLQQGVYVFQLSINSGASMDQVQVTVNPAIIYPHLSFPKRVILR